MNEDQARDYFHNLSYVDTPGGIDTGIRARIERLEPGTVETQSGQSGVWPFLLFSLVGSIGFSLYLIVSGQVLINLVSPSLAGLIDLL